MEILETVGHLIGVIFSICYAYQFVYLAVALLGKKKRAEAAPALKDYAVLICARNEETVIGDLCESLKQQTYPQEKLQVFVMADNCEDGTARIAEEAGAVVYTRRNKEQVGKGYALEALLSRIRSDYPAGFDGYFVFDADNLLEKDYIEQMHRRFSQGYELVTGYRNSKNYGDNWISAGYSLWYLRESRYLNYPRDLLGTSCFISGTGFMFSRKVAEDIGNWPFHLLTEDVEFTADRICGGERVAFCREAVLYDEQPRTFRQSWWQRLRWSKGYLQVCRKYGWELTGGIFRGRFACFDMLMSITPAFVLSALAVICHLVLALLFAARGESILPVLGSFGKLLWGVYSLLWFLGAVTTLSEWRMIKAGAFRKLLYMFTFPLFMFTYVPISLTALVTKVEWKPIKHGVTAKKR